MRVYMYYTNLYRNICALINVYIYLYIQFLIKIALYYFFAFFYVDRL
jgi:hypothetical protein